MSNPRCVVDTNVLISAGLTPAGTSRRVLDWIVYHGRLLISAETLAEFATRFVSRAKFDCDSGGSERVRRVRRSERRNGPGHVERERLLRPR